MKKQVKGNTPSVISARELFESHSQFVASFLFRLGVPASDVPDLVQEVFIIVHRKNGFVPGTAKPRSWLCAIAVRIASDFRRSKHQRATVVSSELDVLSANSPSPEDDVSAFQGLDRVQKALAKLSEEHREVFVLFEIESHSCAEIAQMISVPVGTVYSRLHNARQLFLSAHLRLCSPDESASHKAGATS